MKEIIDLSIAIEGDLPSDPPMMIPKVEYVDHKAGAEQMTEFFPGLAKEQLPNGLGWSLEKLTLTTHSGTHLDAPYHYHPYMDQGKPALTIDQIPLQWCFSDGVVLDFSDKPDGDPISAKEVAQKLDQIDYRLKPFDIVLIRTGADQAWGTAQYLVKGAGMTRESTLYLVNQRIRVVGIDAWSWDRPLPFIAKEFSKTGNPDIIWEAHFAGIDKGYCHMEKLAHLDQIPKPFGFKVACFPIKIKSASAAWVRAVAIIE